MWKRFDEDFRDSACMKNNSKMEVSLDTAQYRPDELKITVDKGVVCVEGRHEEKAGWEQDGEQKLLQEVHSSQGRQGRGRCIQPFFRRCSCHHCSKKGGCHHKCEGGPEVKCRDKS